MADEQRRAIAPEIWQRVFQQDADGVAILEELTAQFVDSEQLAPGQPDLTAYKLGQKALVMHIIRKSLGG